MRTPDENQKILLYNISCFSQNWEIRMKQFATAILMIGLVATTSAATTAAPLTSFTDQVSYSMGFKTGQAMKTHDITINTNTFSQGLQAGYENQKPALTNAEMQTVLTKMQKDLMEKMKVQFQKMAAENEKTGQAFLEKNKKAPHVITLPSGLQYKIIDAGQGNSPSLSDTVTVNYEGSLINGKVFDSSYQRGKPVSLPVKDVIPGWQEALTHMKPGATWMLYIPSNLAYGERGSLGGIGPNETLIFKVNLMSIKTQALDKKSS